MKFGYVLFKCNVPRMFVWKLALKAAIGLYFCKFWILWKKNLFWFFHFPSVPHQTLRKKNCLCPTKKKTSPVCSFLSSVWSLLFITLLLSLRWSLSSFRNREQKWREKSAGRSDELGLDLKYEVGAAVTDNALYRKNDKQLWPINKCQIDGCHLSIREKVEIYVKMQLCKNV